MAWLIRALRPRDWLHFLALPLLSNGPPFEPARLGVGVTLAAGCLAYAYGLNNLSDAQLDRNLVKNPVAAKSSESSLRTLRLFLVIVPICLLSLAASSSLTLLVIVAFELAGSTLYSSLLRLKRLPLLGTATNLWIFVPLCYFGSDRVPDADHFIPFVLLFSAMLVQNQLIHELKDATEDRSAGIVTTASMLGSRHAMRAALLCGLGSICLMIALGHLADQASLSALCALPILLVTLRLRRLAADRPAELPRLQRAQRWAALLSGAAIWLTVVAA